MTLHFMHIGKTGGTAIKRTLHDAKFAYWRDGGDRKITHTPFGPIRLQPHKFLMKDLPDDDLVFFCVRDPVARFVSAFHSRRRRGGDAYKERFPWSEAEEKVFARFETPQQLALALGSDDDDEREFAQWAMKKVRHAGFQRRYTGTPESLLARSEQIVYIARQETLANDWEQLKEMFELPRDLELISDPARAHKRTDSRGTELDDAAVSNLREWYAPDYKLLATIEDIRAERGWGSENQRPRFSRHLLRTAGRARRLAGRARRAGTAWK